MSKGHAVWESYRPIFELFDQALDKPITLTFKSKAAATKWRHQAYKARLADRNLSKLTLPPGDPAFGRSAYDQLQVHRPNDLQICLGVGLVDESFTVSAMEGIESVELSPKTLSLDTDLETDLELFDEMKTK